MRIAIDDLPRATRAGEPGVRTDEDGRIWIPLGLNVYSKNAGRQYNFPQFAARRDFEHERKAGGRVTRSSTRAALGACSHCEILIGRGFHETELYVYPRLVAGKVKRPEDKLEAKILCGGCATSPLEMSLLAGLRPSSDERHILPVGFCLVAHNDWAGAHGRYLEGHWAETQQPKIQQLFDELADPWTQFWRTYARTYRETQGSLSYLYSPKLFAQWLPTQQPSVLTFTDLYARLCARQQKAA